MVAGRHPKHKPSGPTAGSHTFDVLDFVALVAAQIPDKGQVLQRYYGYCSSRARGMRRKATEAAEALTLASGPADVAVAQPRRRRQSPQHEPGPAPPVTRAAQ